MEIRVLRYFLAIAREGGMTGAANVLHVTQPTLSRQIRELEDELGTRLFVRHSHCMSLTPDGMRLRKRAEEVVALIEKAEAEFAVQDGTIAGDIHIGAGETRIMRHVADIIREIRQDYPPIHIHLHSGNQQDVTERLDKGLLDFGLLIQPADLGKYEHVALPANDVWGVITRKTSALASRRTLRRRDLLGEPLLLSRQAIRRTSSRNTFLEWFGEDFAELDVVGTFNLVYNAAILAESGIGHVITLAGLVDISEDSVLCFRLLEPCLETALNIVWKRQQIFSPAAEVFLRKIRAACGTAG